MTSTRPRTTFILLGLFCAAAAQSQQPQSTATVPKLVRFSGSFHASNGMPAQPVESVTLSVYSDQTGGTALWQETQNVAVDSEGKYSVLMGSTQTDGIPVDLFNSADPRWLGAQFNRPGEAEQPRVLLASVPYALKSVDAETLGGKPASAYLLAPSGSGLSSIAASTTASGTTTAPATSTTVVTNTTAVKPRANNGTPGFIGVFTDATDLGNSVLQQSGGFIGLGTVPGAGAGTTPSLDLRTQPFSQIGMAQATDYLTFFASDQYGPAIYWNPGKDLRFGKGGTPLYNAFGFTEQMRIQSATGNVGIGTQNPGSKLDVAGDVNLSGFIRSGGTIFIHDAGVQNTAVGQNALAAVGLGEGNTAVGAFALQSTTGNSSTGIGNEALMHNTADGNTAVGSAALQNNSSGGSNTAVGTSALSGNTMGIVNTAIGMSAMLFNTIGNNNTASGAFSLLNNTGGNNTAGGAYALYNNTTGGNNVAIGYHAAFNVSGGNSFNIHIGNQGAPGDNATIRIGDPSNQTSFYVAGVNGVTTSNSAVPVLIDTTSGQLGVTSSSRRYKEDIEDMGETSRDLMRLRPVTFRYKKPFADGSKPIQYGLIAEEVDEVYPDLVAHSPDGQIETVKYQVLDSMLLNEVQRQQAEIRRLEERLARLEAALEKAVR